jgi:hypothetical protein
MKRALVLASCVLSLAAQADLIAKAGGNELRLTNSPCTSSAVLSNLKADWHDKFKAAQATVEGRFFHACWIDTERGVYFVAFDDGESLVIPVSAFTESGV